MASDKESDVARSARIVRRERFKKPHSKLFRLLFRSSKQSSPATEPVDEQARKQVKARLVNSSKERGECSKTSLQPDTRGTSQQGSKVRPRYVPTVSHDESSESLQHVSQELAADECLTERLPISPAMRRGDPTGYLQLGSRQWYWEDLNRMSAQAKLLGQPDGTFLVRPTANACHYYAASLVKSGEIYHVLVKHCRGWWSFYSNMKPCKPSVTELIESAMKDSTTGTGLPSEIRPGCLSRPLLKPMTVPSLQDQCALVVQVYTPRYLINKLPLPNTIKYNLINSKRY